MSVSTEEEEVVVVGNPNVGKSVLFKRLTGHYVNVSNYPGTTVEMSAGTHRGDGRPVVDTPGTNSLIGVGEDERVTRDLLLERLKHGVPNVLQVCDAKNLSRGLALTVQLSELGIPLTLAVNMLDEAKKRGYLIDIEGLAGALGIDVYGTVAVTGEGLDKLVAGDIDFKHPSLSVDYGPVIEQAVSAAEALLGDTPGAKRGLALLMLGASDDDTFWHGLLNAETVPRIDDIRRRVREAVGDSVAYFINRRRFEAASALESRFVKRAEHHATGGFAYFIGGLAMHPVWGVPVALTVLYAVYVVVGEFGAGVAVDFVETVIFGNHLIPWLDSALRFVLPAGLEPFFLGEAGAELGTGKGLLIGDYGLLSMAISYAVAIILPIVTFFFLAFSIMEDSGYLPRLAVMLNRLFKAMGLNGKAVLPMILGLGCDTMATMTARILPTKKERILVTLLLALAVPCSAQLGVILAMMASLSAWAGLVWVGTIVGVMILVGLLANKLLPGESGDFVLELPPMRMPSLTNVVLKTLVRVEWYLKEAVPLFLLGTFALWSLDRLNVLGGIQKFAAPVVQGVLGLPPQAADAFLIGFFRRDYGAAGLFDIFRGSMQGGEVAIATQIQVVVAMVTITLFIPCVANLFMMVKERGWRTATSMVAFILPFAFVVGGVLNYILRTVML